MKRGLTIIVNIAIIAFIISYIGIYSSQKREESNQHELTAFQNTAETAGQIIANYLADEQHLCDIWASYINHYASEEGSPMAIEEAIEFTRRASISSQVEAHIIYYDDGSFRGLSSTSGLKGGEDYTVTYKGYSLFANFSERELDSEIRQTAAFANPKNGILSMAFLNTLTLRGEQPGETRKALLMRIIPISEISRKLVYLKGEYEDVDLAIIDEDGIYMIHGGQLKNSSLFEYYKSYNDTDYVSQRSFEEKVTGETGLIEINGSKGQRCVLAHTPVTTDMDWFLINIIPKSSLIPAVVDWKLLGVTIGALVALLLHNMVTMMKFNRRLFSIAQEAKKANAAKSNFLSMMSHDIRTPMNAITGFNEMIRRESQDANILRYSEGIRMADRTLLSLINDILDFSKLEAGKLDIIPTQYDLVSILNDLVNMIQVRTDEKHLSFIIHIDPMIPCELYGDELRIKQCVLNLLSNALKYTSEGSITFTVGYEVCPEDEKQILLKVAVADTGCGIKQEDIQQLFVAFKRLEENKNRNIEGSGLGLSITQSLLAAMGSTLEVESEYGKGSVFSFAVRQGVCGDHRVGAYEEAFRVAMQSKGEYKRSFIAPSARLLVVDDAPLNLSVFTSLLKSTQVSIDTAESGIACLGLCEKNTYDVIFLDHMMPDMDGIETLHALKKITANANTPVICLTANAIAGMKEMFLSEGFTDYLTKPIDYRQLEAMLMKYIPADKIEAEDVAREIETTSLPKELYTISGLDVNAGLSHCGDAASYLDTLKLYCEASASKEEELRRLWEQQDAKNLTIQAHSLKSTSRAIGAIEVGNLAEVIEAAGREGRLASCEESFDVLLKNYRELRLHLEEMFPSAVPYRLLLVDDDPLYLKMLRGWFGGQYQIAAAKEGMLALKYLENHDVDLILLDYEMKDMDGPTVLEHLREHPSTASVPVVFLTGNQDPSSMETLLQQPNVGYLQKSMGRDAILRVIEEFFASGHLSQETEESI